MISANMCWFFFCHFLEITYILIRWTQFYLGLLSILAFFICEIRDLKKKITFESFQEIRHLYGSLTSLIICLNCRKNWECQCVTIVNLHSFLWLCHLWHPYSWKRTSNIFIFFFIFKNKKNIEFQSKSVCCCVLQFYSN